MENEHKEADDNSKRNEVDFKGLIEYLEVIAPDDLTNDNTGLFIVKGGNEWIKGSQGRPIPRMLFSEFWFETELCILFADTNVGKSILAVSIADSISRGVAIPGFKYEAVAQPVLYFDFELSDKQFENRYSIHYTQPYEWHPNFYRAEINPDAEIPEKFDTLEEYINYSLDLTIIKTQAKVLIIDNLTYLKNETERAKDALPLMKHLKYLKSKHGLSILALAHTPKRDPSKPITRNDLQGSKMLINFCDSSFAIGESSTDRSLRYIKQIKQRNTEEIYGPDNVLICNIVKPGNFLKFEYLCTGTEWQHLKERNSDDEKKQIDTIMQLKKEGMSTREIGIKLGISHMKVSRILKNQQETED